MAGSSLSRHQAREGLALIAPLTLFLMLLLGFPLAVDLVYSVSQVTFETIFQPSFSFIATR